MIQKSKALAALVMTIRKGSYLCGTNPDYLAGLSPASVQSLRLQGGPFSPGESAAFERLPHAGAAVRLRHWDDAAKVPGLNVPDLDHYLPGIERLLHQTDRREVS